MNEFRALALSDKDIFERYAGRRPCRTAESSFSCTFIWNHKYQYEICPTENALYIRFLLEGARHVKALGVLDWETALTELWALDPDARLHYLTGYDAEQLRKLEGLPFELAEIRESADYLYRLSDLSRLEGKKYHAKRNFCNRFERENAGRWVYEPIGRDNLDDVWAFQDSWCRKNDCASNLTLREESTAIAMALYNLEALGAKGGLLKVDDKVAAFTVGSRISPDTLEIHIEKADYDISGAYQMIFREFIRTFDLAYVSREDDMGLENLRKAKLSYNPCEILMKYTTVKKRRKG